MIGKRAGKRAGGNARLTGGLQDLDWHVWARPVIVIECIEE